MYRFPVYLVGEERAKLLLDGSSPGLKLRPEHEFEAAGSACSSCAGVDNVGNPSEAAIH